MVSQVNDMPMILPPPELDLSYDFKPIKGSQTLYVQALVSRLGVAYIWSQMQKYCKHTWTLVALLF